MSLVPGVTDNTEYGWKYGTYDHKYELAATFQGQGADVQFDVFGFDLDHGDEVSVFLNDVWVGYLSEGPNNGLNAGDTFIIPSSEQQSLNTLRLVQRSPGWKWGVTGLHLEVLGGSTGGGGSGGFHLDVGIPDEGEYGWRWGTDEHKEGVAFSFDGQGEDLDFFVTGFDIDSATEITVKLNGEPLGNMSQGPNDDFSAGDTFRIPADDQQDGTNYLQFSQKKPGWKWGVTNLLVDRTVPSTDPPTITSTAMGDAAVDTPYLYDANGAIEANGADPMSFSLDFGPEGMTVTPNGALSWTPTAGQQGQHSVRVRASNDFGNDTQSFSIDVAAVPNEAPVVTGVYANPGTILDNDTAQLDVVANDNDGPEPLTYQWSAPAGTGSFDDASAQSPVFAPSSVASPKAVTLTVDVSDGTDTTSATVNVVVEPSEEPNTAPNVSIGNPAGGAQAESGTTMSFSGSASDAEDGDLSGSIEWRSNRDGALGTGSNVQAQLSVGSHTVTATVSDSGGLTDTASINVTVDEPEPEPDPSGGVDMTVSKIVVTPDPAKVNAVMTYRVTLKNLGDELAPRATVTLSMPQWVRFLGGDAPCNGSTGFGICSVGDIPAGQTATVEMHVYPTKTGTISTTVVSGTGATDVDTSNNATTVSTTVK